ncbi:MAG: alpha/beta hydrolase [Solirubrobacteraceae bacterium]
MIGRKAVIALMALGMVALLPAASGATQPTTSTSYAGTLADSGSWIADVPSPWNGTLILYSHGYGSTAPADSPDPSTKQALLDRGYALAGSSYDPTGSLWQLGSAVRDQFETLSDVERTVLPSRPHRVFALGTSMGGLISSLEDESSYGRLDGALTTCGIVAGGLQLGNYQLDGEYALDHLLAGDSIQLVNFTGPTGAADSFTSAVEMGTVAQDAQNSAAGRARLALALSLMNTTTWAVQPGTPMPAPHDYVAQEQGQYNTDFGPPPPGFPPLTVMEFVQTGRQQIELAAGGNPNWTAGVDFKRLVDRSSYKPEIEALYRAAGLNLNADLRSLTRAANIKANVQAVRWMVQTSDNTGRLQVPELDMHTIADQLVPVQQENYYRNTVAFAGRSELLRQSYVQAQGHCNFTPSELVAGVQTIQQRVNTGRWDHLADPATLNATAAATGLGTSAFIPYEPAPLTGVNGPFNPFRQGIW